VTTLSGGRRKRGTFAEGAVLQLLVASVAVVVLTVGAVAVLAVLSRVFGGL
jgi:hypothetical protein